MSLPITWEDKENSPELMAWVQQFGEKNYLNAEQINSLKNGINELFEIKLNVADYNYHFKGKHTSLGNLQIAYPIANSGDYAIVDPGTGVAALEYIWDLEEGWVKGNSTGPTTTDTLTEGSINLYFSIARVLASALTGISFATGGAIVSTDTVLQAFGKLQKQINDFSQRQSLFFYPSTSTVTFTADQKNMHISRFNAGTLNGSFGLTFGNGIPETGGVIDMSYLGDTGVPFIAPFDCIVEGIIIRYSRNVAESGANTNLMFRMMSDTRYSVNNQMVCDYNLTGTTHIANEEVSVSVTVGSHSTITKGGGLKFCVRTNNATAQQFNIFRLMVIVKKV
jgi:hypothetical protein